MASPQFLSYKSSRVCYYRFGNGPQKAVCFHGYGENGLAFQFLGKHPGNDFTFYAIDLPFHGLTEWNEGLILTITDLRHIVKQIISEQPATNNQRLSLIGFSLGGRVALSLYQDTPAQVNKLVLLAPDGLKVNGWYWLATQTWPGNKLFAFTMKYPGWFFGLLKIFNALRLVNSSIFKFVNYYIGDAAIRKLLYQRWTTLRKLKPSISLIKQQVKSTNTAVRLVYGRHDRIILSSVGERFRKGIEDQCSLTVIASGHQVLHEKHAAEIIDALQS